MPLNIHFSSRFQFPSLPKSPLLSPPFAQPLSCPSCHSIYTFLRYSLSPLFFFFLLPPLHFSSFFQLPHFNLLTLLKALFAMFFSLLQPLFALVFKLSSSFKNLLAPTHFSLNSKFHITLKSHLFYRLFASLSSLSRAGSKRLPSRTRAVQNQRRSLPSPAGPFLSRNALPPVPGPSFLALPSSSLFSFVHSGIPTSCIRPGSQHRVSLTSTFFLPTVTSMVLSYLRVMSSPCTRHERLGEVRGLISHPLPSPTPAYPSFDSRAVRSFHVFWWQRITSNHAALVAPHPSLSSLYALTLNLPRSPSFSLPTRFAWPQRQRKPCALHTSLLLLSRPHPNNFLPSLLACSPSKPLVQNSSDAPPECTRSAWEQSSPLSSPKQTGQKEKITWISIK